LPVKSLNEAINFINQGEKPLGAYIFSEDQDKIEKFFNEVHAGNTVSNGVMLNYGCEFLKLFSFVFQNVILNPFFSHKDTFWWRWSEWNWKISWKIRVSYSPLTN
jgi:hypothetical protein